MSMLLQEAQNKLTRSNNRSLINFIQQRQCQSEKTMKKDNYILNQLPTVSDTHGITCPRYLIN
jgi:hypothetical protein